MLIWGAGFIATKAGIQYAAPFTFLSLRFLFGLLCLLPILLILKPRWPQTRSEWFHIIVAGLLMHAIHLSGSHYAQFTGMSAGAAAIILAAQTLLTAIIAALWMGERPTRWQWIGIFTGLTGVAMVVWHKLDIALVNTASLAAVVIGLLALTAGTLYQRRFCAHVDLRSSTAIQFAASLVVLVPLSFALEGATVRWAWPLFFSLLFLVLLASIYAVNALHTLMRRGEATRVSGMLYWPPIVAVVLEFFLFDVTPTSLTILGVAVTAIGVALTTRKMAA